jgi:hypothetical protein
MKDTAFVRIPAILLAVIALWPLAGAFHWFGVNVATVEQMSRTDPLGLRVFPAALMFLRPTLAAIAALTAVHITWRVLTSHPLRAPRTFINGAGTLVLFAVTLLLTGPAVNSTLTRLLPMFENRRTPGALVRPGHFVVLQQTAGSAIVLQLFGLALACAVAYLLVRQRSTSETDRAAVGAILPSTSGPAPPGCRCRRQDCPTCRRL